MYTDNEVYAVWFHKNMIKSHYIASLLTDVKNSVGELTDENVWKVKDNMKDNIFIIV